MIARAPDVDVIEPDARGARLRAFFARSVGARGAARAPRIQAAFARVPRELVAGPGLWFISAGGPWQDRRGPPAYVQTPNGDPAFL